MDKRVYLTKVIKITRPEPVGETQVPYLASLPLDPQSPDDPYHWDVVYDDNGDPDGVTPGTHDKCFVGVYTTETNHQILENDPDIIRVDNL